MPEWLAEIPLNFWAVLGEMAPYLLFGFLVAGVLSVFISPEFVERHLGGRGFWPVVKASAFGVPLPLCSCGVIPVAASIRRHGATRGATTAFLVSTPQTGVDSILVTLSLLGPIFAVFRPVVALASGILGGAIVSATDKNGAATGPETACHEACCSAGPGQSRTRRAVVYGFLTLPRDIGRTLLVGLAVAGLISAIVPKGYFSTIVPPGPWQILVLMLVGIPVYICATASVPVAAGLILAGVSPGAAFALLMTGPATNAATVATIWKVLGKRTCLIYLATMMVAAFVGGLVLDRIMTAQQVQAAMHGGWMPAWVKTVSAIALLGVLAAGAFYRPRHEARQDVADGGPTLRLHITGMTCSHCADAVRKALLECPGVETVQVDRGGGRAQVSGSGADAGVLCEAVQGLGYGAEVESDTGVDPGTAIKGPPPEDPPRGYVAMDDARGKPRG